MPSRFQTLFGFGVLGISQPIDTTVALINAPGPGKFKIWGHGRHSLADGLKLTSPMTVQFASGPIDTFNFGPIIVDVPNKTAGIIIALNVATGGADAASATIYAERMD